MQNENAPQPLDDEKLKHAIREILRVVNSIRNFGMGTAYNEYVDQILALLQPKIEEAKREEREKIVSELTKIADENGEVTLNMLIMSKQIEALKGGE